MDLQLITVAQVAARLSVGKSTVWRWTEKDQMPAPVRLNGVTRWRASDIDAFIEQSSADAE